MNRILLFLVPLLFVFSCKNQDEEKPLSEAKGRDASATLPKSNGGRLDFIVVCKDALWDGIAGDYLRKYFIYPQYGLPQPEAAFTLRQVNPKEFNDLLKHSRNLIILEEGPDSAFRQVNNVWARPQLVSTFTGSPIQIARCLAKVHVQMRETYYEAELALMRERLSPARMEKLPTTLRNNGVQSMLINKAFEVEYAYDSLLVMWNKALETDQGIIAYFRPMRDDEIVESNLVKVRNTLVNRFVPGEYPGSYMTTELEVMPPEVKTTTIDGMLAFEMRGLWRTEGEAKGGPFLNYTILDEKNQRVIMLEGFIYGPKVKKRNLLFELEAMLRSIDFQ